MVYEKHPSTRVLDQRPYDVHPTGVELLHKTLGKVLSLVKRPVSARVMSKNYLVNFIIH